jgi:hypothetical protein
MELAAAARQHSRTPLSHSILCAGIVDTRADGHLFFVDRLEVSERLQFHGSLVDHLIDHAQQPDRQVILPFEPNELETVEQIVDDVLHGPDRRFEYAHALKLDLVVEPLEFGFGSLSVSDVPRDR